MGVIIILFFIAIILAFGMLMFRAWEIRTLNPEKPLQTKNIIPEIYFRHIEKSMLYLAKHVIQWIVLVIIKYWFIIRTKIKKLTREKLPKIYEFFRRKPKDISQQENSFIQKAILESKVKIRHIREKVKREHEN